MADEIISMEHNQEEVAFLEKELRHISGIIKQRGRRNFKCLYNNTTAICGTTVASRAWRYDNR